MRVDIDVTHDIVYIAFCPNTELIRRGEAVTTMDVMPGISLDMDVDGRLLGIEIQDTTGMDFDNLIVNRS